MNLINRIQRYLQSKNEWVPDEIIYALAMREGYPRFVVAKALKIIGKTAPYTCEYRKGSGKYYRWFDMSKEEAQELNSF